MADKDVNIHVEAKDADAAKRDIDRTAQATENLGKKTEQAGKKGAKGTEEANRKLGGMGRILTNLKGQVGAFFGAWLGFQGVQRVIGWLIDKLERIQQIQSDIYDKSVQLSELGQALEMQTGTVGKQQYWTEQIVAGQKAGGLRGPGVAKEMMTSMDIVFADQGGIKDAGVLALYKELAPFVGAAQMTGEDVAKLFEFAGTVGVEPTADAYNDYFGKVVAGYTASKATNFGAYMIGLQKGATGWIGKGGSFMGALSIFSAARAATSNESLAANLLEQTVRLSGGGYEKPVRAMERALGVKWSDLSMDERAGALMEYVRSLPESTRDATLAKQGFPVELAGQIGKLVGPEATRVYKAAREDIKNATPEKVAAFTDAYMRSMLGQERVVQAEKSRMEIEAGPGFAAWQRRLRRARKAHEILVGQGRDSKVLDRHEPTVMAIEEMLKDLWGLGELDAEDKAIRPDIAGELRRVRTLLTDYPGLILPQTYGLELAGAVAGQAEELIMRNREPEPEPDLEPPPAGDLSEGQSRVINYNEHYDYSINLNPVAGNAEDRLIGPPFDMYA